ncbi:hypothetical protein AAVH_25705 [Aphelenchoides avenae]|nr:hypothetical protein AAVH_25705 [Aphelenchus avenae]
MAAHLSRLAKYHIADFVNHKEVTKLPKEWHEISEIYHSGGTQRHWIPLPEYVMTKEYDLGLRKDVFPTAVEYLFTEGPEAVFWYKVPTGLLSTIVESFLRRSTETPLRPILCVCDSTTPGPTLLWQELYVDFFPCRRCQRRRFSEEPLPGRERPYRFLDPSLPMYFDAFTFHRVEYMLQRMRPTPIYIIEVFHVKNPASGQGMTIELWFDSRSQAVVERFGSFQAHTRFQERVLRRVKIYSGGCTNPVPIPLPNAAPLRRRRLLAELMLEAYRFLDRNSLDVSQLVCDDWRGFIERSSEQLALYTLSVVSTHVACEREQERVGGHFYGAKLDHEWVATFVSYSACFGDVNSRKVHFLNSQPPAHSSDVIRRHLRNAFVKRMSCSVPTRDFAWTVGMLLGLSDSTLVEELDVLFMRKECLTLLGRFEEALVRRRVHKLSLTILDPLLNALIVQHNVLARPSIQQLKTIKLCIQHLNAPLEPYWTPALYEPSEGRHLAIRYQAQQHAHGTLDVARIHSALRQMMQDFETNGRDVAVDHFSLSGLVNIPSLVTDRKPAYEGVPVPHIANYASQRWNVYCYETADKTKCLTLFVPADDERRLAAGRTDIHLKRGKITNFR